VLDTRNPTIAEPTFISPEQPYDMVEHSAVLFCESEDSVKREELTRLKPEQMG
jgi:hypothetical protein